MNQKQRYAAIAAAAGVVLALLFPPFSITFPNGATRNLGFGFLFSPAEFVTATGAAYPGNVNLGLLAMEWAAILIAAAIAWHLLKD